MSNILKMKNYKPTPSELGETGWNPEPGNLVLVILPNIVEIYNDCQYHSRKNQPTLTALPFKITGLHTCRERHFSIRALEVKRPTRIPLRCCGTPRLLIDKQITGFISKLKENTQDGWRYPIDNRQEQRSSILSKQVC